jgi:hypothetical protein
MDKWIGRLAVLGQIGVVLVCGALVGLGRDSLITDMFLAASGGLITAGVLARAGKGAS